MTRNKLENLTSEHALLALFIIVSGYMVIVATQQYPYDSAIFPQFVGIVTLVGSTLLLLREYLPKPLYDAVAGSIAITGGQQSEDLRDGNQQEPEPQDETVSTIDRPISPGLFTGILFSVYIGLSYLFSMVLMTPPFVVAYLVWVKKPWYTVAAVTALATVLAWAFGTFLITPVDEGVFVDSFLNIVSLGVV